MQPTTSSKLTSGPPYEAHEQLTSMILRSRTRSGVFIIDDHLLIASVMWSAARYISRSSNQWALGILHAQVASEVLRA